MRLSDAFPRIEQDQEQDMSEYQTISLEASPEGVAVILLNRPE